MVRDVFRWAKENAPAIIFIDEVDAIATARFDAQTGADREVQRILMELLNQVKFLAIINLLELKLFATSNPWKKCIWTMHIECKALLFSSDFTKCVPTLRNNICDFFRIGSNFWKRLLLRLLHATFSCLEGFEYLIVNFVCRWMDLIKQWMWRL